MAMAMSRNHATCVTVLFLGLLIVGCQGQLLPMQPGSVEMMSFDPRRILAATPYYISYGSLNANRAPCPSGQGRSYYSANCEPTGGIRSHMSGPATRSLAVLEVEASGMPPKNKNARFKMLRCYAKCTETRMALVVENREKAEASEVVHSY